MIVIDASVAVKLLLTHEKGHIQATVLLKNHISHKEEILVPELLFYEVANALATKSSISQRSLSLSLTKINKFRFSVYHSTPEEVKIASKLAKRDKTSVYDMLYAVVAKNHKVKLITADEQFIKQTGFKFVQLLYS